jgi:hypothetical protein
MSLEFIFTRYADSSGVVQAERFRQFLLACQMACVPSCVPPGLVSNLSRSAHEDFTRDGVLVRSLSTNDMVLVARCNPNVGATPK